MPLGLTSYRVVTGALENWAAIRDVDAWLEDMSYQTVNVYVREDGVVVTIEGVGELRPLRLLANQLAQTLQRPLWVELRILPSQIEASNGNAP